MGIAIGCELFGNYKTVDYFFQFVVLDALSFNTPFKPNILYVNPMSE